MEKRFTMNDVPSGEELFDAIKCNIHGLVKGYYRVSRVTVIGNINFCKCKIFAFNPFHQKWAGKIRGKCLAFFRNIRASKSSTGQNVAQPICSTQKAKN